MGQLRPRAQYPLGTKLEDVINGFALDDPVSGLGEIVWTRKWSQSYTEKRLSGSGSRAKKTPPPPHSGRGVGRTNRAEVTDGRRPAPEDRPRQSWFVVSGFVLACASGFASGFVLSANPCVIGYAQLSGTAGGSRGDPDK